MFFLKKNKIKKLVILGMAGFSISACAYVANSSNYQVQSDSLNTGGGNASSASYGIESSVGEISTGESESTSYVMDSGYQQTHEVYLSMTAPSDITMTALSLTQSSAVGDTTWTVITDNVAGYSTTVKAETSDACSDSDGQGFVDALCDIDTGESFKDILLNKHLWAVSSEYAFGWSAVGSDVSGHGTDSNCIATTDVPSDSLLWQGFAGSNTYQIASSTSRTSTEGVETTLCVATEQETVFAPSGTYQATTTITVITL